MGSAGTNGFQMRRLAAVTANDNGGNGDGDGDLYIIGAVCHEKAPLSVFKRFCRFSCFYTLLGAQLGNNDFCDPQTHRQLLLYINHHHHHHQIYLQGSVAV